MKTSEDLKEFPSFPKDCKSALCKNLSKEIWDEYKDQSDKYDVTFKTCIFSGVANFDSGIGVYAGSHDAYTKFDKLFDPIIADYHGHAKDGKHKSNMDASKLDAPPFSEEDAKFIKSTRIRVGRNLDGYPLGPGVTKEQRLAIMNAVVKAAESYEGDLMGNFYPLEGMDKTTQD